MEYVIESVTLVLSEDEARDLYTLLDSDGSLGSARSANRGVYTVFAALDDEGIF